MREWNDRLRDFARGNFLAEDLNPRLPHVELTGDRQAEVENHRGMIEYSDTVMRVALADGELRITGCNLELSALTLTELTVSGTIRAVEYLTKEEERV
ncbi:MAG: YabP/YqfC family sporulation protein [Clostridiaceae bacterium]|nr:YabP/YqfC family sporulation protein [Clostridiaceae bacterium]